MYELLTKNPCIDICEFNKKNICKACGRTKAEKKGWKNLSKQEKHAVWLRILETHASGDKKKARKLRARYEKVSRASGHRQTDAPAPDQSSGGT
ncbi:putative Fe-S protein YdhL (DUF1289 family) [Methylohalomonas lacus]|uniref:Fe-S protein YdhL (DUF1289 family) n=1 Tax=Methylohalomonas lacus TaxID=398773 RepID=A0AAE3HM64_9GAMM|nr:DUF1289 domain-containing protein [Methylohalomonas lacus]MCS3903704.1 putative Fe-S protein YdhL (DUF1289 family) [Methylohalomonas lacus]